MGAAPNMPNWVRLAKSANIVHDMFGALTYGAGSTAYAKLR
jgi:hypothetical protein